MSTRHLHIGVLALTPEGHQSVSDNEVLSNDEVAVDQVDSLVRIIELVRTGVATSRPALGRESGLGRSIVTQRVEQAIEMGLIEDAELGPSTGGRAPRQLRFRADRGVFICAIFGALNVGVGIADLSGTLLRTSHESWDISRGPEPSLDHVCTLIDRLLGDSTGLEIWGITVGVPGPVEFMTGHPVAPPIMPGWNGFGIREWMEERYHAPVWVDNDVNLMALGEMTRGVEGSMRDMLFIKVGTGIGAGLISSGHVHRGANGGAGDVGHIIVTEHPAVVCRCGQIGCLEAIAGGWALARDAETEARAGSSVFLSDILSEHGTIRPVDVADGARRGDPVCIELVAKSGRLVGENVASMVNFFNPSVVAIGGTIASTGDAFLAAVRQTVYRRSLPLATRDLRIIPASTDHEEGLVGAASLAVEQVFGRESMRLWIGAGAPFRADRSVLYGAPVR